MTINGKDNMEKRMKISYEELDYDNDYPLDRAKELKFFKLKLDLPEELEVTGYNIRNEIIIRRKRI